MQPPFRGAQGYPREGAQGLPHFHSATFRGAYPFAEIAFTDETVPVEVTLEAFNHDPARGGRSSPPLPSRYRLANRGAAVSRGLLDPQPDRHDGVRCWG
jgi:hypothetical protein